MHIIEEHSKILFLSIGKFQPFDYGSEKNLEVYNQTEVPEYNLDNVLCEITVFFALDDNISNKKVRQQKGYTKTV